MCEEEKRVAKKSIYHGEKINCRNFKSVERAAIKYAFFDKLQPAMNLNYAENYP